MALNDCAEYSHFLRITIVIKVATRGLTRVLWYVMVIAKKQYHNSVHDEQQKIQFQETLTSDQNRGIGPQYLGQHHDRRLWE